jgi:hypothetical protein
MRATNAFAPATLADAGLWMPKSKSVIQAASPDAIAIATTANAAFPNNGKPRRCGSLAGLVVILSIRPRLGAPK